MSHEMTFIFHETAVDGLPTEEMSGRVLFVAMGQLIPGWPADYDSSVWVSHSENWSYDKFSGVDRWVECSLPVRRLLSNFPKPLTRKR